MERPTTPRTEVAKLHFPNHRHRAEGLAGTGAVLNLFHTFLGACIPFVYELLLIFSLLTCNPSWCGEHSDICHFPHFDYLPRCFKNRLLSTVLHGPCWRHAGRILHNYSYLHGAVILQKLTVAQVVKNIAAFYETCRFIIVFPRTPHWTLFWARWTQSTP